MDSIRGLIMKNRMSSFFKMRKRTIDTFISKSSQIKRQITLLFFLTFSLFSLYAKPSQKELYEFYIACARGNIELTQAFLEKYPDDVNTELMQTFENYTEYYTSYKHFAEWLIIEKNIKFDTEEEEKEWINKYKRYPINIAARYGNLYIVNLLLDNNCDVTLREENGLTSFTVALMFSQDDIACKLMEYDTSIKKENEIENKFLLNALYYGNLKTAEKLINKGFDINQVYGDDAIPLLIEAIRGGNIDSVKLLLKHNVKTEVRDNEGRTPLMYACAFNNNEIIDELIKQGFDVNAKDNSNATPLIYAVQYQQPYAVKLLIDSGANYNYVIKDLESVLTLACKRGNEEIVDLLLSKEADLYTEKTPLLISVSVFATIKKYPNICYKILSNKRYYKELSNTNVSVLKSTENINGHEYNLLALAAVNEHFEIMKLLIDNGFDINLQNDKGETPILLATFNNKYKSVQFLIDHGADIDIATNDGIKPINIAAYIAQELNDYNLLILLYGVEELKKQ